MTNPLRTIIHGDVRVAAVMMLLGLVIFMGAFVGAIRGELVRQPAIDLLEENQASIQEALFLQQETYSLIVDRERRRAKELRELREALIERGISSLER